MEFLIFLSFFAWVGAAPNFPQVHEDQSEHKNIRTVRQPNDLSVPLQFYQPQVFNFNEATQQDMKRSRYALQQQSDLRNLSKRKTKFSETKTGENIKQQNPARKSKSFTIKEVREDVEEFPKSAEEEWSPINPTVITKTTTHSIINTKEEIKHNNLRTNKKLTPNSFFHNVDNDLDGEGSQTVTSKSLISRHDQIGHTGQGHYIYIQPNILKNNFGIDTKDAQKILKNVAPAKQEANYAMLNDLIGKNPNVQLEGLKKLLEGPNANNIFPVIQGPQPFKLAATPTPIAVVENKEAPHPSLQVLQAQLDASSKEQANNVLARAQQEAMAHVHAQHKAIALAADQAKKEAFAKIAALQQQPQALALTAVPVHQQQQAQIIVPTVQTYVAPTAQPLVTPTAHTIVVPSIQQTPAHIVSSTSHNFIVPTPQTHPAPKQIVSTATGKPDLQLYAPNHNHHQIIALLQAERVVASQVKKQNEAILHAQAQKEAARHQAFIQQQQQQQLQQQQHEQQLQQQQKEESLHQTIPEEEPKHFQHIALETDHHLKEDEQNELTYASKYAFGYRIKDNKMGNDFGHEEKRDGKTAKGHYHVLLPDGRVQNVEYYADNSGYHAKVSYQNLAHH